MAGKRPALPDRTFTVGAETYTLRYSVRAMAALQEHYGLDSIDQVGERLQRADQMGVEDIVAVLWAGLRTHHRDLTKDDALGILDDLGLEDMQTVIGEAFAGAVPEADPEANGVRPPTPPGRSTASSRKARRSA